MGRYSIVLALFFLFSFRSYLYESGFNHILCGLITVLNKVPALLTLTLYALISEGSLTLSIPVTGVFAVLQTCWPHFSLKVLVLSFSYVWKTCTPNTPSYSAPQMTFPQGSLLHLKYSASFFLIFLIFFSWCWPLPDIWHTYVWFIFLHWSITLIKHFARC